MCPAPAATTTQPPGARAPQLTVIVPLHDAPENLERCLAGLRASTQAHELVLVDDASSDARTLELLRACEREGAARLVRLETNRGPAAARNAGAAIARGDVLVFVDSDVVVHPDTLARFAQLFAREPALAGAFGSYDDRPAARGLVSEYRNLLHHWTHHRGAGPATSFWAGCGALRRSAFEAVGGFDESYGRPSIEDIELGMRLSAAGHALRLCPEIQGTHLKRWRLLEMIAVDVGRRAAPWTRLMVARPELARGLNLESRQKACVAAVFAALGAFALAVLGVLPRLPAAGLGAALTIAVLWANRDFYALLARRRGAAFALGGAALHLLYFVYAGLGYLWGRVTPGRDDAARRMQAT